jgi:hypothetical protein
MIIKKYDNPFAGLSKPELLILQQCSVIHDKEHNKLRIKLRAPSRIAYTAEGHQFIEQTLDKIQPIIQRLLKEEERI